MISPAYCEQMAQYNALQNKNLMTAAADLSASDLVKDRGAFFGTILGTFNHLLWADEMWMSRLGVGRAPSVPGSESAIYTPDWATFAKARVALDERINEWAGDIQEADLADDLSWYSGMLQKDLVAPRAFCLMHFFNHQTHHRGQIHAMLTAAGTRPGPTDLAFPPIEV